MYEDNVYLCTYMRKISRRYQSAYNSAFPPPS